MRLSEDRYWDILLHYKPSLFGKKSLVDDPLFFLAADGRKNPRAELEATLKSFFQENLTDDKHPPCRFIARYAWLKEQLNIDDAELPLAQCTQYNEVVAKIEPRSAVLVFPSSFSNRPASMFGHTLVRINSSYQSDLLSHAVNYAAYNVDRNGFLYAFKGIFGYYEGYYSILPYYEKVAEYNDMENRDIWEYELNLTTDEVQKMVMHIWELDGIYSNYYFFDENCAFNLLFLLEAARPSLQLTDVFWNNKIKFWVIPTDTIRVIKDSGMVAKVKYRPSRATRILAIASSLKSDSRKMAIDISEQKKSPQSVQNMEIIPDEKKKLLDLSTELIQYKYAGNQTAQEEYLKLFLSTLKVRSELGAESPDVNPVNPLPAPELGHRPGKFTAGIGIQGNSFFTEIGWRAVYHDLLDPDDGYIEGSQVNFLDIHGRYFFKEDSMRLQSFRLIDIVSIAPLNEFFKPISWKINTGFDRELLADDKGHLIYRLNPGVGLAYKTGFLGLLYTMLETDLNLSDKFSHRYALGFGVSAGILNCINERWKINLSVQNMYYELGDEHQSMKATLAQNFRITTNNSITLFLSRQKTFHNYQTEMKLMWNLYL